MRRPMISRRTASPRTFSPRLGMIGWLMIGRFARTGAGPSPTGGRTGNGLATGSTAQTTSVVTPSEIPIIESSALLELVRWCEQRRLIMEDSSCLPVPPPIHTERSEASGTGKSDVLDETSPASTAGSCSDADRHGNAIAPPRAGGER
jgi:hypothetical protein